MSNVILKTEKLCKRFATSGEYQNVLNSLDLEIKEKDFTVIMGASGSGKSTLLYALSGMDTPTSGKVLFDNTDLVRLSNEQLTLFRRENCGFVFQSIYLINELNILDNILAAGMLRDFYKKNDLISEAKELLGKVGIGESYYKKYPGQLSGGERQRVAIVRAIINNPKILLADEPTGALNSASSNDVLDVFSEINRQGQTIILVTHDIKTALRSNRLMYFRDGKFVGELNMEPYSKENYSERFEKVNTFLGEMGW